MSFLTADIPFEGDARIYGADGAMLASVGQNSAPGLAHAVLDLGAVRRDRTPKDAKGVVAELSSLGLELPSLLTNAFAMDKWMGRIWYRRQAAKRATLFESL